MKSLILSLFVFISVSESYAGGKSTAQINLASDKVIDGQLTQISLSNVKIPVGSVILLMATPETWDGALLNTSNIVIPYAAGEPYWKAVGTTETSFSIIYRTSSDSTFVKYRVTATLIIPSKNDDGSYRYVLLDTKYLTVSKF